MSQPVANPLKERLMEDMKVLMKAKDPLKLGFVRMLLSEVKNVEINNRETFKPEMGVKAVASYVKKLQKSIEEFKSMPDKVQAIQVEIDFCQQYLPKSLSEDELRPLLKSVVEALPGEKNFGVIMKAAMQKVGDQADGQKIQSVLRELTK